MCDCREALFGDTDEVVAPSRRLNRVDSNLDTTVGSILEADWEGDSRGELAVELGFSRTRSHGAKAYQIVEILGGDCIQHFCDDG